jgi:hypothetical protein
MSNNTPLQTVTALEDLISRLNNLISIAKNYNFDGQNGQEGFIEGVTTSIEMTKIVLKYEKERANLGL